jgi:hypothetical protein
MRHLPVLTALMLAAWLMLPTLAQAQAQAQAQAAEWQLVSHAPGLTLYTRAVDGQDLKDFRGVLRVQASMRQVVHMLVDADNMPQWFFNMQEARLLEINGPDKSFLYFVIKGLWPVSDRDAVVRLHVQQDARTLVLQLVATAAPEHYPPMRNRVRMPRLLASWTITPLSAHRTEVRFDGHADPGGSIPVWMANLVAEELPRVTLRNLRQRLESQRAPASNPGSDPRIAKLLAEVKFPEFSE